MDKLKLEMFARYGFCFNPVMTDKTTFVYTAGLLRTFKHPELFILGFQQSDAQNLIGVVYERLRRGERFDQPMIVDDIGNDSLLQMSLIVSCGTKVVIPVVCCFSD